LPAEAFPNARKNQEETADTDGDHSDLSGSGLRLALREQ
jgi:hypothetical protein